MGGFSFLGLYVVLNNDTADSESGIYVVLGVLLLIQAAVYWVVYFFRMKNMELWGKFFYCQLRDLQKPNSKYRTGSRMSTSRGSERMSMSPLKNVSASTKSKDL